MTKNRARKQATRNRAALTGERYVVAQRTVAEPLARKLRRLDALTHRLPGVPPHIDGGLQARAPRNSNPKRAARRNPEHGEPRVLVAWQNWIARRLGVGSR